MARAEPCATVAARVQIGRQGRRIVGFDNELGKGDHMHVAGTERPYSFTSLDRLLADFFAEVRKAGGEP